MPLVRLRVGVRAANCGDAAARLYDSARRRRRGPRSTSVRACIGVPVAARVVRRRRRATLLRRCVQQRLTLDRRAPRAESTRAVPRRRRAAVRQRARRRALRRVRRVRRRASRRDRPRGARHRARGEASYGAASVRSGAHRAARRCATRREPVWPTSTRSCSRRSRAHPTFAEALRRPDRPEPRARRRHRRSSTCSASPRSRCPPGHARPACRSASRSSGRRVADQLLLRARRRRTPASRSRRRPRAPGRSASRSSARTSPASRSTTSSPTAARRCAAHDHRARVPAVRARRPTPPKPGLVRDPEHGAAIEVEVWALDAAGLGEFVAAIPAPLGVGKVELADGTEVTGFLCEPHAADGAPEITATAAGAPTSPPTAHSRPLLACVRPDPGRSKSRKNAWGALRGAGRSRSLRGRTRRRTRGAPPSSDHPACHGAVSPVELDLEVVEALVPARAVARGLADLVERVDQRQHRAGAVGLQLEAQRVGTPPDLEQLRRIALQHLAVEAAAFAYSDTKRSFPPATNSPSTVSGNHAFGARAR